MMSYLHGQLDVAYPSADDENGQACDAGKADGRDQAGMTGVAGRTAETDLRGSHRWRMKVTCGLRPSGKRTPQAASTRRKNCWICRCASPSRASHCAVKKPYARNSSRFSRPTLCARATGASQCVATNQAAAQHGGAFEHQFSMTGKLRYPAVTEDAADGVNSRGSDLQSRSRRGANRV